jgi:hypothetical protein
MWSAFLGGMANRSAFLRDKIMKILAVLAALLMGSAGFAYATTPTVFQYLQANILVMIGQVNNSVLSSLPSTAGTITRLGYATNGDSPALIFTPSGLACSLNGGSGDGGSQVPTSDGKCWLAQFVGTADASQFGASPSASASANAAALQNWLNVASSSVRLTIGPGTYNTNAALANTTVCNSCTFSGTGTGGATFNYTGANTTNDILTIGNYSTLSEGVTVNNFRVTSSTTMTGGAGIRLNMLSNSHVSSIYAAGIISPVGRTLFDGVMFAGIHEIFANEIETYAQHDCLAMYGNGSGGGDIYLTHHLEFGCTNGIHVGGNLGGVFVGVGQSIYNSFANVVIDNSLSAVANSVLFFGNMFHTDGVLTTQHNYWINETVAGAIWLQIAGETGSAVAANINIVAAPSSNISISAPFISGSAKGVYVQDTTTQVNIASGVSFISNTTGIDASAATTKITSEASYWGNSTDFSSNTGLGGTTSPTPTASSGTFTSASASVFTRATSQHVRHVEATVTITTNGSAAGVVYVPLPFTTTTTGSISCRVGGYSGYAAYTSGGATLTIAKYDGTYPGGSGYVLYCSGEIAN